ncbi:hypothetical protein ACEPAF_7199 [Sanghuangporus sanghuang]
MLLVISCLVTAVAAATIPRAPDPCAAISGKTWVAPSEVRACFESFPVVDSIKSNILDVVEKTLAFHTSVNYQIRAPEPFANDVQEDILADIARIRRSQYTSEFEMHIDLQRSTRRLMDGHCVYFDLCYDSTFVSYLPTPVVHLTDEQGQQAVHIAPEAFDVVSVEFANQLSVWQDALPEGLSLGALPRAKVLAINGDDPFVAVNANAAIAGTYQALGTRQNGFFSSYQRTATGWNYTMGNFAQMSLPLFDSVDLTIQRVNSTTNETITLPYRSRLGSSTVPFTDSATFRQNNCRAIEGTNGVDAYSGSPTVAFKLPGERFAPSPTPNPEVVKRNPVSIILDDVPHFGVALPERLQPAEPVSGSGAAQFYVLDDGKTGILALGSFSAASFSDLQSALLGGLQSLTERGATQLIVDVTNNGGGFVCIAAWLHRIIVGPKDTTEPQALLDTKARAGPLAQLIVDRIVEGADPDQNLWYNSLNWNFANNTVMPANFDWLENPVRSVINERSDAFSQRLGQECQPFDIVPPSEPLFDPTKVVIVGNGRCGSSCTLFSVTMNKVEGSKTVVVGGKNDIAQEYAGVVGGQSLDYASIDTEIKTSRLKSHPLAPPDFVTNSIQTLNWRLAFGVDNPEEPEEWQSRPADINFPLTFETVNNPTAIWEEIVATVL